MIYIFHSVKSKLICLIFNNFNADYYDGASLEKDDLISFIVITYDAIQEIYQIATIIIIIVVIIQLLIRVIIIIHALLNVEIINLSTVFIIKI